MTDRTARLPLAIAALLLALAIGWHAWWVTRAWTMPGLSGHEFRQAQTAISIWAMKQDGIRMDYPTPVLGKPWSVPFEFPVYEGLATVVSNATGLSVVQSGRWVSLVAFYLTLPAFAWLIRRAGFSPIATALAMVPLLFAPVFLLYSRAVMIESTALCASAWYLACLMSWRASRRPALLVFTLLAGIVGVLAKSTTWALFCVPWGCCALADGWTRRSEGWATVRRGLEELALAVLPVLLVGFAWVWMSDQIKEMNPVGAFLTSGKLKAFNFGTLAQRHDPQVFRALWTHFHAALMPGWVLIVAALALLGATARGRKVAFVALAGFVAGPAVFVSLYAIHDYYFFANAAGACLALGALAAGWWDAPRRWWAGMLPGAALVGLICLGEYRAYRAGFYRLQVAPDGGTSGLTQAIRRLTGPRDVIVMHSPDWSSITAYMARRRMLVIPDSQMFYRRREVEQGVALLSDERVPLVVFRGESRRHADWIEQRMADFHLNVVPLFTWQDEATVYARRDLYPAYRQIIEHEAFSGVAPGRATTVEFGPAVAVAGTPQQAELTMFGPRPLTVSTPYYGFRPVESGPAFFAHPPTELVFALAPDARQVELGYRVQRGAYANGFFAGVYVLLILQPPMGVPVRVNCGGLGPADGPSPRRVTVRLPPHDAGRLIFQGLPGPANNNAYDWLLLEYLRIR